MSKPVYDYTRGPILHGIWRLAWPAVTSMFFETFLSITDAFWVGKLGTTEMAAVTSSMFPIWTLFSVLTVIPTGLVAIISRAVGAGEAGEVSRAAGQGLLFAIRTGVIIGAIGFIVSPYLFNIMGTEPEVTRMGVAYLQIFFCGIVFFCLNETLSGIFRAVGDAQAYMMAATVAVVLNIVLDPLLIFGLGPFPRWGVSGASVATIISAAAGTGVALLMIKRGRLPYRLNFRFWGRFDWRLIGTIFRIGFPPAISGITFSAVYIFLNRIVAEFGTISIAALMIGHRMESLSFLTCFGFSMAASTMVGQNLGAGQPDRAAKSVWIAVLITAVFTLIISILFLVIPRQLSAFFIGDEKVIEIAVEYLKILALSQIFMAAEIVINGAFAGAGDTIPPTAVSIPGSIARLPVAYYLAFVVGLGISGVWWALTITTWVKGLALVYWFSRGRWKKVGLIRT